MNRLSGLQARIGAALPAGSVRARLAGGAFWSLSGTIGGQAVTAVGSILVARILGKVVFGEFGVIRTTVLMFSAFAVMGMGVTASKHLAEFRKSDPGRAGQILALAMCVALLSGAIMTGIVLAAARPLASGTLNAPHLTPAIFLCAPALFLAAIGGVQTGALIGLEAFRHLAVWNAVTATVQTVGIVFGAWQWGLTGALTGLLLTTAIASCMAQWMVNRVCGHAGVLWDWKGAWSQRGLLLSFAIPSMLSGIMFVPVTWLAAAMLARRPGGFGEMGVFNAASNWRTLILFVPQAAGQVVLPLLASLHADGEKSRFIKTLWFNTGLNLCVGILVAAPMAAASPWIMGFYGADFRPHWLVLVLLAGSAVLTAINNVIGQALISIGRMWWALVLNVLWAVELLGFSWLFVDHGAVGLAWAYLLSYLLHTLQVGTFTGFVLRRRLASDVAEGQAVIVS